MKIITTKSDLDLYLQFLEKIGKTHEVDYSTYKLELIKLPDHIQESIINDVWIKCYHVSTDLNKGLLIASLRKIKPDYKIDRYSDSIITLIAQYYSHDPEFIKDDSLSFERKGLLIMGAVGTGKTLLWKGINEFKKIFKFKKESYNFSLTYHQHKIINSYSFTEGFAKSGYDIFRDNQIMYDGETVEIGDSIKFMRSSLVIDDIGAEDIVNHYGSITNVIGEVIKRRYENVGEYITHGTTNLDEIRLKEFYGDRVYSRMIEMFNFLIYEGKDRRH